MKRMLRMSLCAVLAAGLLASCGAPAQEPAGTGTTEEETEAARGTREPVTEDPIDYGELGQIPFAGLEPSPEGDFTVSEVPGGVTVTGYTGSAERVRIPDRIGGVTVTAIGEGAFRGQGTVRVLWIPDSVTVFGSDALVGMPSLYALHTPLPAEEGKQFLGWLFGAETYERNNVEDLRRIDFLEIGGSLTELPAYALFDCNDLVTVRLPAGMTAIGSYALARCAGLKTLDVSGLVSLGEGALLGCTSLSELVFGSALEHIGCEALGSCTALRRLTLPFVGESRQDNRFLGWLFGARAAELSPGLYPTGLRSVTLLDGAGALAAEAFYAAPVEQLTVGSGLTEIGDRAFADCTRLTELVLPSGVTAIGANAFSGCTALETVTLPEGVVSLGVQAFLGCTALTSVTLPQSLETLPAGAFHGCRSLAAVDLGGVRSVGGNAFRGCTALVTLRASGEVTFAAGNETAAALLS